MRACHDTASLIASALAPGGTTPVKELMRKIGSMRCTYTSG